MSRESRIAKARLSQERFTQWKKEKAEKRREKAAERGRTITRTIGTHAECGGMVEYVSTGTWGKRRCVECGANSFRGDQVMLESEIKESGK